MRKTGYRVDKMAVYRIRKYGESILRQRCKRVENIGLREMRILDRMAEIMYEADGVGLAAPQVGIDKRLIVVDAGEDLLKLANPLILLKEGESILEEGCLSLPEIVVRMRRARRVLVEGWNEDGERVTIQGESLSAHILQHEIDHLSGILIIDYANPMEKAAFEEKLRKLEKRAQKYLKIPRHNPPLLDRSKFS